MINKNWNRWIFASFCKHFDARRGTLPMFVEGQQRNTRTQEDFIELRMDGPELVEVSKDYWYVFVEINILIQSAMNDTDFHKIHKNTGIVAAAFTDSVEIRKYGNGTDDNANIVIGCMSLVDNKFDRERVKVRHLGQVEPTTQLMQSSVEGHYEMHLST